VSSFDVYGSLNQLNITIDEKTIPSPNSAYALSKYAGEVSATLSARSVGSQISILRLAQVFGPGESARYNRLIPKLLKEFSLGKHVELNPLRNCTRQYVSTYQVFAHILDCILRTSEDYELRNVVGHKTEFVEIVKMCNEICNFGTYTIKPINDLDWYQANIQIDYPSFLEDTFNKGYSEHFRKTIREELQYMSKELRSSQ
jgi:nucleoside-diphosphate-sugar epimerase